MTAEDVGWSANKIVLGKLSGRTAFKQRMKELGVELESDDAYNKAFQRFKDLADKKAEIFDEDLLALVAQEAGASGEESGAWCRWSRAAAPPTSRMLPWL
jgi:2-isopropylmalate synthase